MGYAMAVTTTRSTTSCSIVGHATTLFATSCAITRDTSHYLIRGQTRRVQGIRTRVQRSTIVTRDTYAVKTGVDFHNLTICGPFSVYDYLVFAAILARRVGRSLFRE